MLIFGETTSRATLVLWVMALAGCPADGTGSDDPFDASPPRGDAGSASTVTDISRDATGTNGGVLVRLTGTGFTGEPTVLVDNVAATDVVVESSTSLRCVLPAHVAGVHALTVAGVALANPRLAAVGLGGAVHYFAAPTTVFHDGTDFDTADSLGTFAVDASGSGAATRIAGPAPEGHPGFVRTAAPAGGTHSVSLYATFPNAPQPNVSALSSGVFMREYLRIGAAALALAEMGQIKLFLNRSRDSAASWLHGGIGGGFPGVGPGRLGVLRDFDTGALAGGLPSDTSVDFVADTWFEVERYCGRDGAQSVAAMWINGRLVAYEVDAALGTDTASDRFMWELGLLYTQGTIGDDVMTVDVAAPVSGDGWIEVAP